MKKISMMVALVLFTTGAWAHGDKAAGKSSDYESVVLNFESGKATLSSDELKRLRSAVTDTKARGKIDKAQVAVWSDQEFPVKGELAKTDRDLANKRIDAVKQALRNDISRMKFIKTFNMAEQSNWLARAFRTDEAELDATFAKREADTPMREDFDIIKRDGGPSKAVVILKVHDKEY